MDNKAPFELIDRRWIIGLLYNTKGKKKRITDEQLSEVFKKYPILSDLIEIPADFRKILSDKASDELENWINKAKALNINELNSFINGVQSDYYSIINAINLKHNNGLAEGSVNKIKTIKRIMYGRNNFDLLRLRSYS